MATFDDLQNAWNQQTDSRIDLSAQELINKAEKNTRTIKANHWWTIGILTFTSALLLWFFIAVAGSEINQPFIGFSLMILSLLLRVLIEYISFRKFKKIGTHVSHNTYTAKVTGFYKWRLTVHYFCTPLFFIAYIIGFVLLLPAFKQTLSYGFYLYIIFSGSAFFLVFSWFIYKQIKQEIAQLDFLKRIDLSA